MIRLRCQCGKKLKLPENLVGKLAACPQCERKVRIVAARFDAATDADRLGGMLCVEEGPQRTGEQLYLGGRHPIEVGKDEQSVLRLRCDSVSRRHCALVPGPYGWRIEDRESTNGVFVNGRRVKGHNLIDGDRVQIGTFALRYFADPEKKREKTYSKKIVVPADAGPSSPEDAASSEATVIGQEEDGELHVLEQLTTMSDTRSMPAPAFATGAMARKDDIDDDFFAIAPEESAPAPTPAPAAVPRGVEPVPREEGPTCPGCQRILPPRSKICTRCGIDLRTGRPLLTSSETGLDEVYALAEKTIRVISWIIAVGVYPIASEAYGASKPYVIRAVAVITILVSGWFLYDQVTSPEPWRHQDLMLWGGDAKPDAAYIEQAYASGGGNARAFHRALRRVEEESGSQLTRAEQVIAAHESLPFEQQCFSKFKPAQLITHAFLHAGILHLVGNLLFLMVLGSRVNALLGNFKTLLIYPLLAAGAGAAHLMSIVDQPPSAMLGASGAVMGLAGMYFVFFPVHKVHVAAWLRWGFLRGFKLSLRIFDIRGFWVVLFYIGIDVLVTVLGAKDGVAHWAHLGGFVVGAVLALLLLVTRQVDARGGDVLTAIMGRQAWAIIGQPASRSGDETEDVE